ncbi:MAG: universal stress protein, partial [Acidimicrobiales bacterium]|nr:universal stress protein [Acidimicrobiales bacterium]
LALSIARRSGASLHLLHVLPEPSSIYTEPPLFVEHDTLGQRYRQRLREQGQKYLDDVIRRLETLSGVVAVPVVRDGEVADVIRDQVVHGGVDLVVMTTHGRGPLGRMWLGGVADELVRTLPAQVLLVRPMEEEPDLSREPALHRLVLPLDGSAPAERIIEPAVELGRLMGARYTLVRVVSPTDRNDAGLELLRREAEHYLEGVAEEMRARGLDVQTCVLLQEQPAEGILDEARRGGGDLIALETHGRRGLPRLFLGSVADKLVRGGSVPILVHCRNQ